MGDRKPFQFLRHLRILTLDVLDDILRCIWSNRLPSNVQAILTGQPKGDLDAAPAVQTVSSSPHPCQRSRAFCHSPTAKHFCSVSRTSCTLWEQSALSMPTFARALGTAALAAETMYHPLSAGTIADTEPESKSVLSPAPTTSRETNTTDINGGTCLRNKHWTPLHHRQDK
jgi:hypothetical protein